MAKWRIDIETTEYDGYEHVEVSGRLCNRCLAGNGQCLDCGSEPHLRDRAYNLLREVQEEMGRTQGDQR